MLLNRLQADNKQTMRAIIKESRALSARMRQILLDPISKNALLETIREIFQLDHHLSLLKLDKTKYLVEILRKSTDQSEAFLSRWFLYFLCDRNYQESKEDDRNQFDVLMEAWFERVTHDPRVFLKFLSRLNECIESLQMISNTADDYRSKKFRDNMVETCFRMSKFYSAKL